MTLNVIHEVKHLVFFSKTKYFNLPNIRKLLYVDQKKHSVRDCTAYILAFFSGKGAESRFASSIRDPPVRYVDIKAPLFPSN